MMSREQRAQAPPKSAGIALTGLGNAESSMTDKIEEGEGTMERACAHHIAAREIQGGSEEPR